MKPPGSLCRSAVSTCDADDHCSGNSMDCVDRTLTYFLFSFVTLTPGSCLFFPICMSVRRKIGHTKNEIWAGKYSHLGQILDGLICHKRQFGLQMRSAVRPMQFLDVLSELCAICALSQPLITLVYIDVYYFD